MKYDDLSVAAIRSLCLDGTNNANSGHPGMALSSAPILYTLFTRHLISDPTHPNWVNRDRFVLSAGHASMLLYTMLHLSGYAVSKEDLKSFRKLGSRTPGHPEVGRTPGVDATAGPLGQGIGQAVGLAVAETMLSAMYPEGEKLFNHYTYCLCGDGCLEEGVSQEAIAYAGTMHLNKLILIYDYNKVTLDGPLSDSSSEDEAARFMAAGWDVIRVHDGNDCDLIDAAIAKAKASKEHPTMIMVDTIIGYGTPKQGTNKVHGSPVGIEDAEKAKAFYHYDYAPFEVPDEVYLTFKTTFIARGQKAFQAYEKTFAQYKSNHPEDAHYLETTVKNDVSSLLLKDTDHIPEVPPEATRVSSGHILNVFAKEVKNLVGGSADVASSTETKLADETTYLPSNRKGRNMNFGIREFAMACIQNGMLLHGGLRTYAGCFLVFSDYMKPAIRLAALSHLPAVYVFTHDSIALGEDGPTHQPVEHLAMLRSIPNVNVIRPADARETYAAWKLALQSIDHPTCMVFTRQKLNQIASTSYEGVASGGYVVSKERKTVDFTLIASGSEVNLALEAQRLLLEDGIDTRVVSLPSMYSFDKRSEQDRESVFAAPYEKRMAIEMLSSFGWYKYAKHVMCQDTFGDSGVGAEVTSHFGFTAVNLKNKVEEILGKNK
ncbi:MAG: transketolase [Bacilli bacterium]|jgi:transketolase|nr:transketolase [Bacilli bacterium]